ncbi:Bacteriophage abortive infection AbiH [Flavobacterium glycines]|nr:Bacteriophage abortive infection AbiH [Flavobacterium glycines]
MNRLVVIGNGFDLAHGLPTSYRDFIDDFWKNFKRKVNSEEYKQFVYVNESHSAYYSNYGIINNFKDFKTKIKEYIKEYPKYYFDEKRLIFYTSQFNGQEVIFRFENDFFSHINIKNCKNWVDIENEYFRLLKTIVKSQCLDISKSKEYWVSEQKKQVEKLNKEFEQIKNLLEKYLVEEVLNKYNLDLSTNQNSDWNKIYKLLKPISLLSNEENVLKEFTDIEDVSEIKEHFVKERNQELVNQLYFLNFNYTPISSIYSELLNKEDSIESRVNFIHGTLGNILENKINFGFGDEMDEDYKMIENIDDNEYLRNFKSFQYLQNSNYNHLLQFINGEKYQVLIVGHSCGLSDRTMLNSIFEHNNCRSIKVFHHEIKDEEGKVIKDNYTEIIQNISRHFNDKKLMRGKIVNKTLCKPLPQIQLLKKD